MNKNLELDNDWANDVKENPIHISQAESGAKGYYCMGCTKPMQAVKKKNPMHQSYFRHHVVNIDHSKNECFHSSKEYREKLAYIYFMRVKQIKVPAVYKYPPKGEDGFPILLQEATTITAHHVKKEVIIFEDENGKIHWNNNEKVDDRFLWIRPDAVFYNEEGKPILFLEFVVTHKPDIDKLNKLQRLGINTVQIIVPKLPEAELEKSISSVSKVKWTYNEIESNTEYISISSGDTEGIPSIDEEQRKLFEESFKCRAAQVGNLIRSITRCLGSQSYNRTVQLFEREIQRIEKATGEHQSRLDEIQTGIESEIYSELEERRGNFEYKEREFQIYFNELEDRYLYEKAQLSREQKEVECEIQSRIKSGRTEEGIRQEFERKIRELDFEETDIDAEQRVLEEQEETIDREIAESSTFENQFIGNEESIREEFRELEKSAQKIFKRTRKDLESKINGFGKIKTEVEDGIRSEFERKYQQIIERVNKRDIQGGDGVSERIKAILELRGLFGSYSTRKATFDRYRKGISIIKNGTWKKWN